MEGNLKLFDFFLTERVVSIIVGNRRRMKKYNPKGGDYERTIGPTKNF
jgi:hypothetical protein